jgi:AraC-like DNA-binding protein
MAATGPRSIGNAGQSYVERPPRPDLTALVSSVWIQRVDPGAAPYRQLNIPTGAVELTCRLGRLPTVRGPATAPDTDTLPPGSTVIGVRLHPGAAAAVLGLPTAALRDTVVEVDELWGSAGRRLAETINEAAGATDALAVVQGHLLARSRAVEPPDPLVGAAVRQIRRHVPLPEVRNTLDISERQLRRRCAAAVGLAPKTLHRVLRFQQFVALTQRDLGLGTGTVAGTIATLAAQVGYADEAHLHRECLRLTGQTPRAFLTRAEQQCACGHDHAASYAPQLAVGDRDRRVSGSDGYSQRRR